MKLEHKKLILDNADKKSVQQIARHIGIKERKVKKFLEEHRTARTRAAQSRTVHAERTRPSRSITKDIVSIGLALFIIAVMGAAVYSNSISGKFIWDDEYIVRDNVYIKNHAAVKQIFTEDMGAGGGKFYGFYRPLQLMVYMGIYAMRGLDVRAYHIVNTCFHILTAFAVYWLVSLLFAGRTVPFLVAAFFTVHPVQTEAIDYISGLGDPLSSMFLVLALVFYIKGHTGNGLVTYILMAVCFSAALFSKETGMIFPALALLYNFSMKRRINFLYFWTVVAATIAYTVLRFVILSPMSGELSDKVIGGFMSRVPGVFVAITGYVRLIFFPFSLHMEYGKGPFQMADPRALAGVIIAAAMIYAAFRERKTESLVLFAIGWTAITFLPVSNLYPVAFFMSEHYLYLPSIGLFMLGSKGLASLLQMPRMKYIAMVFTLSSLAFFAVLTYRQNSYWSDPLSFYKKTLEYAPESVRIYNELGRFYDANGFLEEGLDVYRRLVALDPTFPYAYNNIGVIYNKIGRFEEAIPYFKRALELLPEYADASNNIGVAYAGTGHDAEAIVAYEKAVAINPNYSWAYSNLGLSYAKIGRLDDAIAAHEKAIRLDPDNMDPYYKLSLLLESQGKLDEAIGIMAKALSIRPNNGAFFFRVADLYYKKKEYKLAIKNFDEAAAQGYPVSLEITELLKPYRNKTD